MITTCASKEASITVASDIIAGRPWKATAVRSLALRRHFTFLGRTFRTKDKNILKLKESFELLLYTLLKKSSILSDLHPKDFAAIPVLLRIARYQHFWLHQPCEWLGNDSLPARAQWESFLNHIFENYNTPSIWRKSWEIRGTLEHMEREWYCRISQGEGMKTLPGMPATMNSQMLHLIQFAPSHLSIRQAMRWAQLTHLKASSTLINEVLTCDMVKDFSHDHIWFRLMQKIVSSQDFDPQEFGIIADALQLYIDQENRQKAERLVSRNLQELKNTCYKTWNTLLTSLQKSGVSIRSKDLKRPGLRITLANHAKARWASMPNVSRYEGNLSSSGEWKPSSIIFELTSQATLLAEASRMHHCVDSYRKSCMDHTSSIFVYRELDENGVYRPQLTIEVYRPKRRIVQIRGKWNRHPDDWELKIVHDWATQNQLAC